MNQYCYQLQSNQQNDGNQINSQISQKIYELYEITSIKRYIQEQYKYYVKSKQDKAALKKNYNLSIATCEQLENNCNAFREVRGDGNCFYTAFGYEFLSILLFDYSFEQFQQFLEKIKQIQLSMKNLQEILLSEFLVRLKKLKQIKDLDQRKEQLHTQFAAYEKQSEEVDACLYGLSIIFFRNYSNYVVDLSENKDAVYDRENLLKWEEECNSNEVVIAELAKQLNIFVQLIFIEKTKFIVNKYGNEQQNKIILLMQPGHYNIGYFIQQKENNELIRQQKQEDSN